MKEEARTTLWTILSEAFHTILRKLLADIPAVRMTAGHSHNDAFLFRGYAEYSHGDKCVILSFDIQVGSKVNVSGDISLEDGLIIKGLVEATFSIDACAETVLIGYATEFAFQCQQSVDLIKQEIE